MFSFFCLESCLYHSLLQSKHVALWMYYVDSFLVFPWSLSWEFLSSIGVSCPGLDFFLFMVYFSVLMAHLLQQLPEKDAEKVYCMLACQKLLVVTNTSIPFLSQLQIFQLSPQLPPKIEDQIFQCLEQLCEVSMSKFWNKSIKC